MVFFDNKTTVPVINRTLWMFLLVVIIAQNVYLFFQDDPKEPAPQPKKVNVEKKELQPLEKMAKDIVNHDYPNIICSAQDNDGHKEFIHGRYGLMMDNYDETNVMIYEKDANGGMVTTGIFTLGRCQEEGFLERKVK